MNSPKEELRRKPVFLRVWGLVLGIFGWVSLSVLGCGVPVLAQSQQPSAVPGLQGVPPAVPGATSSPAGQPLADSISGRVVDQSGMPVIGALVSLRREDQSTVQEVVSGDDGEFSFVNVPPGPFHLMVTAAAFKAVSFSGTLHPRESFAVPQIVLALDTVVTAIKVTVPRAEKAKIQFEDEKKQRVLGFIPNYFVTYYHNAVALTPARKFELAWKSTSDPLTVVGMGSVAGVEQGLNSYSGYGQGAEGYAKRFGAAYADFGISTFIGSAALPSLMKQDPRYFYKGSGSVGRRFLYALATSVICKGDNGHWQVNYSRMLGDFATGGISNLYYPAQSRDGVKLAYENAVFMIGLTAIDNLLQEFLIPKLTPHLPGRRSPKN